jgi:hypothetical protein
VLSDSTLVDAAILAEVSISSRKVFTNPKAEQQPETQKAEQQPETQKAEHQHHLH